ncbi:MAG: hypothetical protein JSS10_08670 [Verrucomicrobia bacterium]|nr:hypothetical protein [Verrucomicrobiota bacterium]
MYLKKVKNATAQDDFTSTPLYSSSPSAAKLDPVFSQAHPKTSPAAAFVKASPPPRAFYYRNFSGKSRRSIGICI